MEQENQGSRKTGGDEGPDSLERQVERGSLFTHTALSHNANRIHEAESFLYGIIDVLIGKGIVTKDEIATAAGKVRQEMDETGQTLGPGLALRIDGDVKGREEFLSVNCSERLHLCKAACCSLHFALSVEEVESGVIKWDLGEPYYIRQESTGYCTHLDSDSNSCVIYQRRPPPCQRYSCEGDDRIWKDFEDMVPNEEWLDAHLGRSRPRLVELQMLPQNIAFKPPDTESASSPDETKASGG